MAWIDAGHPVGRGRPTEAEPADARRAGSTPTRRSPTSSTTLVDGRRATRSTPSSTGSAPTSRSSPWCSWRGTTRSRSSTRWRSTWRRSPRCSRARRLAVMHAASQDLEVLDLACGALPDARCSTRSSPRASSATPSRRCRRWSSGSSGCACPRATGSPTGCAGRSATSSSRYAAADVAVPARARTSTLTERLEARGRLGWALEECELHAPARPGRCATPRRRGCGSRRPGRSAATGGRRRPGGRRLARAAGGRDRSAGAVRPARTSALVGIAQRAPTTLDDLSGSAASTTATSGGTVGDELLDAVPKGRERPASPEGAPGVTASSTASCARRSRWCRRG